jgi:succinate dehydrogenase / fumarate reductase, cytochrome b subunit
VHDLEYELIDLFDSTSSRSRKPNNSGHAPGPEDLETKMNCLSDQKSRVNVRALDYVTYRGGTGMIAWLLHRLTGLGVLVFVFAHVLDTALISWGPGAYNKAIHLYRLTGFRIGEILLVGAVLYHALNGIRITIMDFWPQATVVQKKLYGAVVILFVILYVPSVFIMVKGMVKIGGKS